MSLRFRAIGRLFSCAVILLVLFPPSSEAGIDGRLDASRETATSTWPDSIRQTLKVDTAATRRALEAWSARKTDRPARGGAVEVTAQEAQRPVKESVAALPNATVLSATPEHHNASVSYNEWPVNGAEIYAVLSRMTGSLASSMIVMQARSATGGAPGSWSLLGSGPPTAGAIPPFAFADQWNPTIASHPAGGFWEAHVEFLRAPAALVGSAPSVIVVNASPGAGTPFPGGLSPAIPGGAPGSGYWVDYPIVVVDDISGNPGPPGLGDLHVAWLEYRDLDGDPDGNGVFFDDPADSFLVVTVSTNTMLAGPVKYPAFSSPTAVLRGAVWTGAHQTHRPALSVVGPSGTAVVGAGGVYLAAVDAKAGQVVVAAATAPGILPGWVTLFGPTPVAMTPLPPSASGVRRASSVSIAVDNGPVRPTYVYIAWADYGSGDADVLFRSSSDGGVTWQPAVRVNQDPFGNGRDQWAPHLVVNPVTGALHVTFFDRRTDPSNIGTETWTSTSADGGLTWTDALVSDAGPTPPVGGVPIGLGSYVGDYLYSDVNALNAFGAIWNDGRGAVDQDIFFAGLASVTGDSDGDGVPDTLDNCPTIANPGQADGDFDGRGDACDLCPGFDDLADADGDGVPDGCDVCAGFDDLADADGDGVPDGCDVCAGFDDLADADGDGVPDGCDVCAGFDDLADADGDGVPDGCDVCAGFDDLADADGDGVPDGCDLCSGGNDTTDTDGDGVPDACDICPGGDDLADADSDGTPDFCDGCPVDSSKIAPGLCGCGVSDDDSDADGTPDCVDLCPGFDDSIDVDGDAVPDGCDNCPAVFNADQDTTIALTGDVNQDGVITSADIIYMVNFVFKSGFRPDPCEGVGDVNCSGSVTSADIIYMVNYTFKGGPAPCDLCAAFGLGWSCP